MGLIKRPLKIRLEQVKDDDIMRRSCFAWLREPYLIFYVMFTCTTGDGEPIENAPRGNCIGAVARWQWQKVMYVKGRFLKSRDYF
jgi:hypothetical protein